MLRDGHVQMEAGPESCFLMSRNVWNTDVEELGKPSREGMCSSLVFQTFSLEESEKKIYATSVWALEVRQESL